MPPVHQVWPKPPRARRSDRGKKTRQTEEEVGRQHQGMDRPGVHQVPELSGEQGKMEETGCEIICGAPVTRGQGIDDDDDDVHELELLTEASHSSLRLHAYKLCCMYINPALKTLSL